MIVQPVDQVIDVPPGSPGGCSFPLRIEFTGTAHVRLYLDASGNPTRILITGADVKGTFTNSATGASVWTPSPNMVLVTFNADGTVTQSLRGLLDRIVVPGQGLITADVGRI